MTTTSMAPLELSRVACRAISTASRSSFVPCFRILSSDKRQAMEALYALMHHSDALADCSLPLETRISLLNAWRDRLSESLAAAEFSPRASSATRGPAEMTTNDKEPRTDFPHIVAARKAVHIYLHRASPDADWLVETSEVEEAALYIFPALLDAIRRYEIPSEYLMDVLDGVHQDLGPLELATFDDLVNYCHHVATAVGLASIRVWGLNAPEASYRPPAEACGLAFQLTNILRDLREDASRGRVYIPSQELADYGYATPEDFRREILAAHDDERFQSFMRSQLARVGAFYREAVALYDLLSPEGRRIYAAMLFLYHRLFRRIAQRPSSVLTQRVRLPRWEKALCVVRGLVLCPTKPRVE